MFFSFNRSVSAVSFGRKTVAGVLANFNQTLDDLKTVEIENEAEAVRQGQIIEEAKAAHNQAIEEASAAREVFGKLCDLIKPTIKHMTLAELKKECV